jgi:hypothetical protein
LPPSRGPSRDIVHVPTGRPFGRGHSASYGNGYDSDEEYDEVRWQPSRSGQRLGNHNVSVRSIPFQSGSRHEGHRNSMGTNDRNELRHLFNSMRIGSPRMGSSGMGSHPGMFGNIMDGPRIGPDADSYGHGSRTSPVPIRSEVVARVDPL